MENRLQMVKAAAAGTAKGAYKSSVAEKWQILCNLGRAREYPAATEMFSQGSSVREVYLIDKGLVKLSCLSEGGQELIVSLRSPGSILGADSAIVQKPHSVTAITLTVCQMYSIALDIFLHLTKTDAQFCWYLHQAHSREVYNQATQMVALKYLLARQRFEQLLWQLASAMEIDWKEGPIGVRLPLKYWEIAQLVGITPEHLSRILRQLEQEEIIKRKDGRLVISDFRKLYHPTDL